MVTFGFEFICEYCVAGCWPLRRLIIRIGWTTFNFEHRIEIKLQLSYKFRLCNLPSSKDFNENKTVARKDELGSGSKSCQVSQVVCLEVPWWKIISLIKQRYRALSQTSHSTLMDLPCPACPGTLHSPLRDHFLGYFYLDNTRGWGCWGRGHNRGKCPMCSLPRSLSTSRKVSAINSSQSVFLLSLRKMIWQCCQNSPTVVTLNSLSGVFA